MKTLQQIGENCQHSASQLREAAAELKIEPVNIAGGVEFFDDAAALAIRAKAAAMFGTWIHADRVNDIQG